MAIIVQVKHLSSLRRCCNLEWRGHHTEKRLYRQTHTHTDSGSSILNSFKDFEKKPTTTQQQNTHTRTTLVTSTLKHWITQLNTTLSPTFTDSETFYWLWNILLALKHFTGSEIFYWLGNIVLFFLFLLLLRMMRIFLRCPGSCAHCVHWPASGRAAWRRDALGWSPAPPGTPGRPCDSGSTAKIIIIIIIQS